MPLPFITVLGSCLVVASAAIAADRPADHDGEPWSNPPTAASPDSAPKAAEHEPAATAGSGAQVTESAMQGRTGQPAELAPDPPGLQRLDAQLAAFQQDSPPAQVTPAEKAKSLETARGTAVKPLLPVQPLPIIAPTSGSEPPPPTAGVPPPAIPSSPTAPGEIAVSLGLGSRDKNATGKSSPLSAVITVGGSLAIVLGLFLVVAWAMRKTAPRGSLVLPKEVFDILGRAPLGARQHVQLLRCGNKLLLVSITPGGTETLTEVTDPLEVDRIAGICHQANPKSATTAFRQVFQQLAPQSGAPSELDSLEPTSTRRKRYRWEEKNA
jgi:flagellar biogenesis protein FliO